MYGENELEDHELKMLEEARLQLDSSGKGFIARETLICECMCVSMGDIRDFLQKKDTNFEDLRKELGLGSGCSSCLKSSSHWRDLI